jgi:hypothetical protein
MVDELVCVYKLGGREEMKTRVLPDRLGDSGQISLYVLEAFRRMLPNRNAGVGIL